MFASFLDNDLYKFLMGQFVYYYYPELEVTYNLTNRDPTPLNVSVPEIIKEIKSIVSTPPKTEEINYLNDLKFSSFYTKSQKPVFDMGYLDALYNSFHNAEIQVDDHWVMMTDKHGRKITFSVFQGPTDIEVSITGVWWLSILFEVPILAAISERHTTKGLSNLKMDYITYDENKFVNDFCDLPDFAKYSLRFSDFGTRRRASYQSHKRILENAMNRLYDYNLSGTSNVHLARILGLTPIGTFAHELPMVIAGYREILNEDITGTYKELTDKWFAFYKGAYSILLPDTFGSKWLFDNYPEMVLLWDGVRHDSGDPFEFADMYINLCESHGVDPMSKVIVFSDSVSPQKMKEILEYCRDRVWATYGVGTNLTHNTPVKAPNIVIKASEVRTLMDGFRAGLVKLSDEPKKNTGNPDKVKMYKNLFDKM